MMEYPDFNLIQQHSNSIEMFFDKHRKVVERINETHDLPYPYAQYLMFNYEIKAYRELQVNFQHFITDKVVNKERLFIALKNIGRGSSQNEFFEHCLAMVTCSETSLIENGKHVGYTLTYTEETHISGRLRSYYIHPYPVTLNDGKTVIGVSIEESTTLRDRLWRDQQTYFLSHVLRSHRQFN